MPKTIYYDLKNNQRLSVFINLIDQEEIEKVQMYFSFKNDPLKNKNKMEYSILNLQRDVFNMKRNDMEEKVAETSKVYWHKGSCPQNQESYCDKEINLLVRNRSHYSSIIENGRDFRQGVGEIDLKASYTTEEKYNEWCSIFDEKLCTSCLIKKFSGVIALRRQKQDELRKEREKKELEEKIESEEINIELMKRLSPQPHFPTGYKSLDFLLGGGFTPGTINILSGYPNNEVDSALLATVDSFNNLNIKSVYLSFSGTPKDMIERQLLARQLNVNIDELNNWQQLSFEHRRALRDAQIKASNNSVEIINQVHSNMDTIEEILLRYIAQGTTVFFISSLQNLGISSYDKGMSQNRENTVTLNTLRLSDIVRTRKITIIATALLNRESSKRDQRSNEPKLREPVLSDLRDSNVLEQQGYNIIQLFRPDFYDFKGNKAQFLLRRKGNMTSYAKCDVVYDAKSGFLYDTFDPIVLNKNKSINEKRFDWYSEDDPF
ncbi:hypothetical protein QFZ48_002863 [Chitinophaga sp. W2I13]|uniref:DnaB-like helicase C-terminal domain-containing protein n=1 Tax=Chitinophaga sp. W2I13 TaxID=3373923 RepID=UPI003D214FD4